MTGKLFGRPALRIASFVLIAFFATRVDALITGGYGNEPISDRDWPAGSLAIANHKDRLGWWEGPPFGGGEFTFLFRGDATAFNEALEMLASINWPTVELHVHRGPHDDFWLVDRGEKKEGEKRRDPRIDWSFTVWTPRNFHNLFNDPRNLFTSDRPQFRREVPPPRIDVYLSGGLIDWSKVEVPARIRVIGDSAEVLKDRSPHLRLSVFDMETSKPVSSARVTLVGGGDGQKELAAAATDKDGKVAFDKLAAGNYTLRIAAEGYASRELPWDKLEPADDKTLAAQLCRAATLSGRVLDSQGKALPNVKVNTFVVIALDGRGYKMPDRPEATTNADGSFELKLPNGFVRLTAQAPDRYYSWSDVLPVGDRRPALEPVEPAIIRMVQTTSVTINVADRAGKPLAGQTIHLEPVGNPVGKWSGTATSDAAGAAVINGVPPGDYQVTDRPYDEGKRKDLHVEEGRPVTTDLRL